MNYFMGKTIKSIYDLEPGVMYIEKDSKHYYVLFADSTTYYTLHSSPTPFEKKEGSYQKKSDSKSDEKFNEVVSLIFYEAIEPMSLTEALEYSIDEEEWIINMETKTIIQVSPNHKELILHKDGGPAMLKTSEILKRNWIPLLR